MKRPQWLRSDFRQWRRFTKYRLLYSIKGRCEAINPNTGERCAISARHLDHLYNGEVCHEADKLGWIIPGELL